MQDAGKVIVMVGMAFHSQLEQRGEKNPESEQAEVNGQHHNDLYPCVQSRPDGRHPSSRPRVAAATSG